ncbi:putative baseplate wedge subunit [Shigella phage ChubbyThor]|nr:putative baseplate wedge subunit [Shigella phage ChubbyThor]
MQDYKELSMQLAVPIPDKGLYQNLHHLLSEGHMLPLQSEDGSQIGYVTSCVVYDKQGEEESGKVSVDSRFVLNKKLDGSVVGVRPIIILYHFNGKEMFRLLSHFMLVVAPAFRTKF